MVQTPTGAKPVALLRLERDILTGMQPRDLAPALWFAARSSGIRQRATRCVQISLRAAQHPVATVTGQHLTAQGIARLWHPLCAMAADRIHTLGELAAKRWVAGIPPEKSTWLVRLAQTHKRICLVTTWPDVIAHPLAMEISKQITPVEVALCNQLEMANLTMPRTQSTGDVGRPNMTYQRTTGRLCAPILSEQSMAPALLGWSHQQDLDLEDCTQFNQAHPVSSANPANPANPVNPAAQVHRSKHTTSYVQQP